MLPRSIVLKIFLTTQVPYTMERTDVETTSSPARETARPARKAPKRGCRACATHSVPCGADVDASRLSLDSGTPRFFLKAPRAETTSVLHPQDRALGSARQMLRKDTEWAADLSHPRPQGTRYLAGALSSSVD